MNALTESIRLAFAEPDDQKRVNKVYLEFIKANFIIPIEKNSDAAEPRVLFYHENNLCFLPAFTEEQWLDAWAKPVADEIELLRLSGVDLLKGIGDEVTLCVDLGSPTYKEFNPSEIARMRSMILKIFK